MRSLSLRYVTSPSKVLDLAALARASVLPAEFIAYFEQSTLNKFMGAGRAVWRAARQRIQALLAVESDSGADGALRGDAALRTRALFPASAVTMLMPADVGDYTDYYSSREHASNVGIMFRGKDNALQPNWCASFAGRAWRREDASAWANEARAACAIGAPRDL